MKTLKTIHLIIVLSISLVITGQDYPFTVEVQGKGQPILLFPGFTCTDAVWEETVTELSNNYECHIFTFAGFGDVPPIEKPWLPKIKTGVEAYVKDQNLKDAIIIGHSLGGALGLWLATEEEHTFLKIIVVDALPSTGALMIPNFKSEDMVYESPWNKQMLAMDTVAFDAMAAQMAAGMSLNKEKQQQIKDWILQADRETYVYGYTDLLKLDLREDIAKINIPVNILAATQPYGLEMVKGTYTEQYKNLKDYDIEFAADAAHFIMYDSPIWFQEKLNTRLAE
ncbi:alpha/beta fold hydrolase [Maribacter chungangensis]|uniref:Alpha/beta fold hydrolase n=1 Tax=Maribacter chungangensis TaxID=1069117 RepID=A0ABW3AZV1_9FLAO